MGNFFLFIKGFFSIFDAKYFLQQISHIFFQKYYTIYIADIFRALYHVPQWDVVSCTRMVGEYPVSIQLGDSLSVRQVEKNVYTILYERNTQQPCEFRNLSVTQV